MAYIPVLILLLLGAVVDSEASSLLALRALLGSEMPNRRKNMPFECGVPPMEMPGIAVFGAILSGRDPVFAF